MRLRQDEIDQVLAVVGDALLDALAESVAKDALNRLAAYVGHLEAENERLRAAATRGAADQGKGGDNG